MSNTRDPVATAALGMFVLALCAAGWYVFTDDEATRSTAGANNIPPDLTRPDATPAPEPKPSPPPGERAAGWIPPAAAEVRLRDAAPPPVDGDKCRELPDLVAIAKGVATGFGSQLREATKLSDSEESALGDRLEREAPKAEPFRGKWDQPAAVAKYSPYVNALVDQLRQNTARPGLRYRVHVVADSTFNAFALPGGVLAVHTGVFEGKLALRNEAELMAVLGHEMGHVERRHPVAAYQYARAVLGSSADEAQLIAHMLQMPIQSEYEHEADARGLALAVAVQYDPYAAAELWSRQAADEPSRGPVDLIGSVTGTLESVLHSHPPATSRCARSLAEARKLVAGSQFARFYRGETNLRERNPGPRRAY